MGWLLTALANLYASKTVKIGALAGGSISAIVIGLHADIKGEISNAELRSKDYTDSKIELMMKETDHLKAGQNDIKDLLKTLDNRIYKLNN